VAQGALVDVVLLSLWSIGWIAGIRALAPLSLLMRRPLSCNLCMSFWLVSMGCVLVCLFYPDRFGGHPFSNSWASWSAFTFLHGPAVGLTWSILTLLEGLGSHTKAEPPAGLLDGVRLVEPGEPGRDPS